MTSKTTTKAKRCFASKPKAQEGTAPASEASTTDAPSATYRTELKLPLATKIGKVIALLERDGGATLDEIVQVTGWLPHTTRAALTGLKKKGHFIERSKRSEASCYRIIKSG